MKIGFSKLDITLPLGTGLAGDFRPRPATGVEDPLYICGLALSSGENTLLLLTVDSLGMRQSFCEEIRERIAERTGVAKDFVILNALHQHTSFVLRPKGETCALEDMAYRDLLYRKFADAAVLALEDAAEGEMYYGETAPEQKLSFVRRYRMKDGSIITNPMNPRAEIEDYADVADNTVRLCRFQRKGKPDVALLNFATHADVVGGTKISADWPGYTREEMKRKLGCECIVANGFEGDVNHIDFLNRPEVYKGVPFARRMAEILTDCAAGLWESASLCPSAEIACRQEEVFVKTRTDGEEDYAICKGIYDSFLKTLKVPKDAPIRDLAYLRRVSSIYSDPIYRSIPVSVARIGELLLFGLGGEPFTGYAKAFRECFSDRPVLTLCCANGFEGYLPTAEAYRQGGYEATASPFEPCLEELCFEKAKDMAQQLLS